MNLARRDFFSQTAKIAVAASTVGIASHTVKADAAETKSGFKKPIISTDVAGEFKKFLYARAAFRERFGI